MTLIEDGRLEGAPLLAPVEWPAVRPIAWQEGLKRAADVVLALLALLVVLPAIVLTAVAIKLDSPGPVLYRARRVGQHGRPFEMLKFRKMPEDASGLPLTVAGDARLTRVGRILTRTKLDEVPQLLNVLRGDMSLVGPRPESSEFVEARAVEFSRVLTARPGITGWSQLAFAGESAILDRDDPIGHYLERILPQKLELDAMYAQQAGLWLDLKLLGWTLVAVVLRRPVAVHRTTGAMGLRRRA